MAWVPAEFEPDEEYAEEEEEPGAPDLDDDRCLISTLSPSMRSPALRKQTEDQ